MLSIHNLSKQFRQVDQKTKNVRKVGIDDVSFSVKPGRILGLVGPNGAGKTTTMRIIANLTHAHSGDIVLDGTSIDKIPSYKKQVSLISAETQAYERLTPREQLELAYELAGLPENQKNSRIETLAENLDMKDFIDRPNQSFSSGMKQKINIARGLVTDPRVVVFDEVTNALDIFAARAVKDEIKQLSQKDRYVIFSTHIMPDAEELCEDIVIIHKGRVREQGEKHALLKKYKVKSLEGLFFKVVDEQEE